MQTVGTLLVALLLSTVSGANSDTGTDHTLRVWTYTQGAFDLASRQRAERLAQTLLDSAGLHIDWRHCVTGADCEAARDGGASVVLILASGRAGHGWQACGAAARDADRPSGTIIVYLPCVAEVALAAQSRPASRSHPLLATLHVSDLVGMAVAHEIGHVLGLGHARTGMMRARLDLEDMMALHSGRLWFNRREASRMRAAIQSAHSGVIARKP